LAGHFDHILVRFLRQIPEVSQASGEDDPEQRIERVLEQGLERVDTARAAKAVVARVERLTAGRTEQERAQAAAEEDAQEAPDQPEKAAATVVEHAVATPAVTSRAVAATEARTRAVAQVLEQVAAQSVAQTPAAQPVLQAARAALAPEAPVSPAARRGRRLLKEAVLQRMGPLEALDARLYLAINEGPHPPRLDALGNALTVVATGGWIWLIAALVAWYAGVPRSWTAVKRLLPSLAIATWLIDYPIKAFFRRRRPFSKIVQALVIGKKPGSWSFPSGHTGSSFAGAWILSTVWPHLAPIFFSLASVVGFSRVYVGAHYPGDVASGALFGMVLSELVRRVVSLRRWKRL
jgi:membrane-associated phospholipid phosphatase